MTTLREAYNNAREELEAQADRTGTVEEFIDDIYSQTYAEERKRKIRIIREEHQWDGSQPPADRDLMQIEIENYLNN